MGANILTKATLGKISFQIDSSGGSGDTYGILAGLINAINTVYTVSLGSYISGSLEVQLNGQLLTQGSTEDWAETTPASGTFTLSVAPEVGDILIVKYQYQTITTGNADTVDGKHASDFVTNTVAGEFENKIIDGDKNTLQDIAYSSIKSTSRGGLDTKLITGTPDTTNLPLIQFNSDGDAVGSDIKPSAIFSGWIDALGETWAYISATTFTVDADVTNKYSVGMKIRLTQTTVRYFIITAVSAYSGGYTTITVYGGTDYTLANAAITSPYYSTVKSPFGFPMSRNKWSITLATDSTTYGYAFSSGYWVRPTDNNAAGGNALADIVIPIGLWHFEANTTLSFVGDANTDDNFRVWMAIVDSTTATPTSTDIIRTLHITQQPSTNSPYSRFQGNMTIELRDLETYVAAKTKRILLKNDGDYGTVTFVNNAGDAPNGTWFRWSCAYLNQ